MNPKSALWYAYELVMRGGEPNAVQLSDFKSWLTREKPDATRDWDGVAASIMFNLYRPDYARHLLEKAMLSMGSTMRDGVGQDLYMDFLHAYLTTNLESGSQVI